ncbi:MAG: M56 family metallopeptidase [Clostridia bacterium]|nr:M56 family metallopeptidase [Clostridia bacterium]
MIWGQILWGALLAGLLGFSFHRAWKWEHGTEAHVLFSEKYGKETYVFVPPTVLFWILLVFLMMFVWFFGLQNGLLLFMALAVEVLLLLSVYYVVLLILLPILRKRFSARACAVLWLVPAFLSWQAHGLIGTLPMPRITIYLPHHMLSIIGAVWVSGFLAVGGYYTISHLGFYTRVRKHSAPEMNNEICAIWKHEQEALDYRRPVALLRADVSAPFSMGQTKRTRCTVLPEHDYTKEELSMIFRHELHHLQRCDVDTKVFLCLCNALCWFNPLVWIATRNAADDLERSCDEIVIEKMGDLERRAYANLLLDSAVPEKGFTTCLSAAAGTLRYRLKSIMNQQKRMVGTALLMMAIFSCVMCFGIVSVSDTRGSLTSLILEPGTEIQAIYDGKSLDILKWDDSALRETLEKIKLEHIAGLRKPVLDGKQMTFMLPGGRFVSMTDQVLVVHDYHKYNSTSDCYLIKSPVDWDALYACFK